MNIKNRRNRELPSGYQAPRLSDGRENYEFDGLAEASDDRKGVIIGFCVFSAFLLFLLITIFMICLSGGKEIEDSGIEINKPAEEVQVAVDTEDSV